MLRQVQARLADEIVLETKTIYFIESGGDSGGELVHRFIVRSSHRNEHFSAATPTEV